MTYKESVEYQLREWLAGRPWHNTFAPNGGECCPDFSCCMPQFLAPLATRQAFVNASDEDRFKFLGGFLGGAIPDALEKTIYVAGDVRPEKAS